MTDDHREGELSAHHEERRAIRAAFEMNLLAELDDDQTGRKQIVPEYYPQFISSVNIAFGIFAVLCVVGVFASLARGKVR